MRPQLVVKRNGSSRSRLVVRFDCVTALEYLLKKEKGEQSVGARVQVAGPRAELRPAQGPALTVLPHAALGSGLRGVLLCTQQYFQKRSFTNCAQWPTQRTEVFGKARPCTYGPKCDYHFLCGMD